MTADATLSAALRALSSDISDSGDADTCALLLRAAKRIDEMHAEILLLRLFAPGQHQAHVVKTIPRIGPTDWRFYGLELAEADFDAFGHPVPNGSEL